MSSIKKYVKSAKYIENGNESKSQLRLVPATQSQSHGFKPRPSHAKDVDNSTRCLLVWCWTCNSGTGR